MHEDETKGPRLETWRAVVRLRDEGGRVGREVRWIAVERYEHPRRGWVWRPRWQPEVAADSAHRAATIAVKAQDVLEIVPPGRPTAEERVEACRRWARMALRRAPPREIPCGVRRAPAVWRIRVGEAQVPVAFEAEGPAEGGGRRVSALPEGAPARTRVRGGPEVPDVALVHTLAAALSVGGFDVRGVLAPGEGSAEEAVAQEYATLARLTGLPPGTAGMDVKAHLYGLVLGEGRDRRETDRALAEVLDEPPALRKALRAWIRRALQAEGQARSARDRAHRARSREGQLASALERLAEGGRPGPVGYPGDGPVVVLLGSQEPDPGERAWVREQLEALGPQAVASLARTGLGGVAARWGREAGVGHRSYHDDGTVRSDGEALSRWAADAEEAAAHDASAGMLMDVVLARGGDLVALVPQASSVSARALQSARHLGYRVIERAAPGAG